MASENKKEPVESISPVVDEIDETTINDSELIDHSWAGAGLPGTEEVKPQYDLEELMKLYGRDVLNTAYIYVKDRDIAEDIYQQVFIKVYQKMDSFRGDSAVKTWILRITINACKDYLKSWYKRNVGEMTDELAEAIPAPDVISQVEKRADEQKVRDALMSLPKKYRDVLICIFYDELSVKETGQVLRLPEGTIKSRVHRGKALLKELLEGRVEYV